MPPLAFAGGILAVGLIAIVVWLLIREEGQDEKRGAMDAKLKGFRRGVAAVRKEARARLKHRGRMRNRALARKRLRRIQEQRDAE